MAFDQRVALVTGGASGIGKALGRDLARRGARVVLADQSDKGVEAAAVELTEQLKGSGRVSAFALDVSDLSSFEQAVDRLLADHGRIDLLFNNAGIAATGETHNLPIDVWNRLIDVNLRGVIHGIHCVYPKMQRQGYGQIVNTACVAGLLPFPMTTAYSATKHAVVGLSMAMRAEACHYGVKINVVCPGVVDTGMFDAIQSFGVDKQRLLSPVDGRAMSAETCARRILNGVKRNRPMITVGLTAGSAWRLYRLAPGPFLKIVQWGYSAFRGRLNATSPPSHTHDG